MTRYFLRGTRNHFCSTFPINTLFHRVQRYTQHVGGETHFFFFFAPLDSVNFRESSTCTAAENVQYELIIATFACSGTGGLRRLQANRPARETHELITRARVQCNIIGVYRYRCVPVKYFAIGGGPCRNNHRGCSTYG